MTGLKIWSCKIFDKFQVWLYESLFFVFIKDIFSPPKPSSLCTSSPCLEYYPERKGVKNNCLRFTGIWWLNCQTRHFNLSDGFLQHCSHMLSEKVHLMQLLFPFSWITIYHDQKKHDLKNLFLSLWNCYLDVFTPTATIPVTSLTKTERIARARSLLLKSFFHQSLQKLANVGSQDLRQLISTLL